MRNLKMFGLALALALAGLTTFANVASATRFESPTGTTYTGEVVATSTNVELHGAIITVNCKHAEFRFKVEEHGFGTDVGGEIKNLTFSGCNYSVAAPVKGSIDVDLSGNVDWFNTEIEVSTSIGICKFGADPVLLGGSYMGYVTEGLGASIHFNLGELDRTNSNKLCGSKVYLQGNWSVTTPNPLWIE